MASWQPPQPIQGAGWGGAVLPTRLLRPVGFAGLDPTLFRSQSFVLSSPPAVEANKTLDSVEQISVQSV